MPRFHQFDGENITAVLPNVLQNSFEIFTSENGASWNAKDFHFSWTSKGQNFNYKFKGLEQGKLENSLVEANLRLKRYSFEAYIIQKCCRIIIRLDYIFRVNSLVTLDKINQNFRQNATISILSATLYFQKSDSEK